MVKNAQKSQKSQKNTKNQFFFIEIWWQKDPFLTHLAKKSKKGHFLVIFPFKFAPFLTKKSIFVNIFVEMSWHFCFCRNMVIKKFQKSPKFAKNHQKSHYKSTLKNSQKISQKKIKKNNSKSRLKSPKKISKK